MKEIIGEIKDFTSKDLLRLQLDDRINTEVIEELEAMEQTEEVIEALKEAYAERKRIDKMLVALVF